jgi:hypothetical protein
VEPTGRTAPPIPVKGIHVSKVRNAESPVFGYALYVSKDGKEWGKAVASGEFGNVKAASSCRVFVGLKRPVRARYVKFVALSGFDSGDPTATIAEIEVE